MCAECVYWRRQNRAWGDCANPAMRFDFVPYSQFPDHRLGFMFKGTIEQWNAMQKPPPMPLTASDYSCQHDSSAGRAA